MNRHSKIFVAGHRGLVGSAILRRLHVNPFSWFPMKFTPAKPPLTGETLATLTARLAERVGIGTLPIERGGAAPSPRPVASNVWFALFVASASALWWGQRR